MRPDARSRNRRRWHARATCSPAHRIGSRRDFRSEDPVQSDCDRNGATYPPPRRRSARATIPPMKSLIIVVLGVLMVSPAWSQGAGVETAPTRDEVEAEMGLRSEGDLVRGQLDTVGFVVDRDQALDVVEAAVRLEGGRDGLAGEPLVGGICPHDDHLYAAPVYVHLTERIEAPRILLVGVFHRARRWGITRSDRVRLVRGVARAVEAGVRRSAARGADRGARPVVLRRRQRHALLRALARGTGAVPRVDASERPDRSGAGPVHGLGRGSTSSPESWQRC